MNDDIEHLDKMTNEMGRAILPILRRTKTDLLPEALSMFFGATAYATSKVFVKLSDIGQREIALSMLKEAIEMLELKFKDDS